MFFFFLCDTLGNNASQYLQWWNKFTGEPGLVVTSSHKLCALSEWQDPLGCLPLWHHSTTIFFIILTLSIRSIPVTIFTCQFHTFFIEPNVNVYLKINFVSIKIISLFAAHEYLQIFEKLIESSVTLVIEIIE